jgi:hypothetical protein
VTKKNATGRKKLQPVDVKDEVEKAQSRFSRTRTNKPESTEVAGPRRRSPSDFTSLAVSGTPSYDGHPVTLERDGRLIGKNRYSTFLNTILNSDVAAIAVRALLILIADIKWKMEPGKGKKETDGDEQTSTAEPEAVEWANIFESMLFEDLRTPWSMHVRKLAMHFYLGFAWLEWQAKKRDDGLIGFYDLFEVSPLTLEGWDLDRNGDVHGIVQSCPLTGELKYISRAKSIYLVDAAFAQGDPAGVGVIRHIVRKVRELEALEQIEKDGYENDLRGVPWARAPLGAIDDQQKTPEEKAAILKPLNDFIAGTTKKRSLGIMMDSAVYQSQDEKGTPSSAKMVDAGIMVGGGTGHDHINNAINRKTQEIARPMFAVGFTLGDGAGNRALAEATQEFFATLVNSIASDIAAAANRDAIPALGELNDVPPDQLPRLVPGAVTLGDVAKVATMLVSLNLAGAKFEPDDPAFDVVRERAKLPPVPKELAERAVERLDQEQTLAEEKVRSDAEAKLMGAETQQMSAETSAAQGDKKLEIDAKAQAAAAKKPAVAPAGGGAGAGAGAGARPRPKK